MGFLPENKHTTSLFGEFLKLVLLQFFFLIDSSFLRRSPTIINEFFYFTDQIVIFRKIEEYNNLTINKLQNKSGA